MATSGSVVAVWAALAGNLLVARIRSAHPEVTALFVKPQSSLSAADRLQQGQGRILSDPLFEEDRAAAGNRVPGSPLADG
jgi:hypothetical protein